MTAEGTCVFCMNSDKGKFGGLVSKNDCIAHVNCLYFAAGLAQNGSENEGLMGFLEDDIKKEIRRCKRLKCHYCTLPGASVGCAVTTCRISAHFPCAEQKGFLFQYTGTFGAYCARHSPKQQPLSLYGDCIICLSKEDRRNSLYTPCCRNGWFHKSCIQQYANSAGIHHFKCPLCANTGRFVRDLMHYGIEVPFRDASWEFGGLYQDLLEEHKHCDAVKCICPRGRDFVSSERPWTIMLCSSCGIQGIHLSCCVTNGEVATTIPESWECDICTLVSQRQEARNDEMMSSEYKERKVILPGETYNHLVQQCRRTDNLSINLKRL